MERGRGENKKKNYKKGFIKQSLIRNTIGMEKNILSHEI